MLERKRVPDHLPGDVSLLSISNSTTSSSERVLYTSSLHWRLDQCTKRSGPSSSDCIPRRRQEMLETRAKERNGDRHVIVGAVCILKTARMLSSVPLQCTVTQNCNCQYPSHTREEKKVQDRRRASMKPKPFRGSNHLTLPPERRAIALIEMARDCKIGAATRAAVVNDLTKVNMLPGGELRSE